MTSLPHASHYGPFRLLVLSLACAIASVALPGAALANTQPSDAVAKLNAQRAANGLPADVTVNSTWSQDCALHDHYLAVNGWGSDPHSEDPSKPAYTADGDWAARRSIVTALTTDWDTWNPFEAAPFHLLYLLRPQLQSIGWAAAEETTCVVISGVGNGGPTNRIYTYPGAGSKGIYYSENAAEGPSTPGQLVGIDGTTGPYIYVFADGPWAFASYPRITQASLSGPSGNVPVKPINAENLPSAYQHFMTGAAMILPTQPLKPNTTYNASVTMQTDGGQLSYSWSFTTGTSTMDPDVISNDTPGTGSSGNGGGDTGGGSTTTPAHVRATLSKTIFTRAQAATVKLTYSFTATSSFFSYQLNRKLAGVKTHGTCQVAHRTVPVAQRCTVWSTVNHVRKMNGAFKGPYHLTAKQLFGGKAVTAGSYRLTLRGDADINTARVIAFTVKP